MGNSQSHLECVFCDIISSIGEEEKEEEEKILSYNENLAILSDLHPAAKHHYLVVPRHHVKNPKVLKGSEHIKLIQDMHKFGKEYLESLVTEESSKDSLFGFHFPPFISIDHLHLHVICPASSMNILHSTLFRENTWYFISPEMMVERLKQKL